VLSIPDAEPRHTARVTVYDLTDPDAWEQAQEDRGAWGKELSDVHTLDRDHVLIVFRSGDVLEAAS
jgi:hypothetical protein